MIILDKLVSQPEGFGAIATLVTISFVIVVILICVFFFKKRYEYLINSLDLEKLKEGDKVDAYLLKHLNDNLELSEFKPEVIIEKCAELSGVEADYDFFGNNSNIEDSDVDAYLLVLWDKSRIQFKYEDEKWSLK